jgi:hypothetical protein
MHEYDDLALPDDAASKYDEEGDEEGDEQEEVAEEQEDDDLPTDPDTLEQAIATADAGLSALRDQIAATEATLDALRDAREERAADAAAAAAHALTLQTALDAVVEQRERAVVAANLLAHTPAHTDAQRRIATLKDEEQAARQAITAHQSATKAHQAKRVKQDAEGTRREETATTTLQTLRDRLDMTETARDRLWERLGSLTRRSVEGEITALEEAVGMAEEATTAARATLHDACQKAVERLARWPELAGAAQEEWGVPPPPYEDEATRVLQAALAFWDALTYDGPVACKQEPTLFHLLFTTIPPQQLARILTQPDLTVQVAQEQQATLRRLLTGRMVDGEARTARQRAGEDSDARIALRFAALTQRAQALQARARD